MKHDIWDHDLQISPILASTSSNGTQKDIVLGAGKMGNVYAFDRVTGALLWATPVGEHVNDLIDPIPANQSVITLPGVLGGVETVMAYSSGMVYVPVVNMPTEWNSTALKRSSINFTSATGELVAINISNGEIAWQVNTSKANLGAATVVNDVVYTADYGGNISAYNATTGAMLFNYTAPAGINAWPAVANNTIIWPCGVGSNASVIALKLGANNTTPDNQSEGGATGGQGGGGNATGAIELTAQNLAFDQSTITVKAGQTVTINFHNKDGAIPHNFAVYTDSSALTVIFKGEIIIGVSDTTYTFTAPSTPGTYFFRCDVHPNLMIGTFVVQ
jgi:plastocyanin